MAEAASTSPTPEADKLARERVEALINMAPACHQDRLRTPAATLAYSVHASFMPVAGADGQPQAAVFTNAYLLNGTLPAQRPVCFAFNGGPGSSSIWLQFGALGPKRVVVNDDGTSPPPPYAVVDNEASWFEHFDLVFIDPPHTGWSLTTGGEARKKMLSVDGDVDALAEVMRVWLTRHQRWGSPVYLAGESYGTTRGAALADKLIGMGVALAGVMLVSCAMDLQSIVFEPRNDLPYALYLPAFANTAHYHGLLKGALASSPEAARHAAEVFVMEEYLSALHAGSGLSEVRRARVARRLSELTGLPRALVEERNLRICDSTYFFEALRPQGRIVGRLESRVTGPMAARRSREWEFDPGIDAIAAPYAMAALGWYGQVLGLRSDQKFVVLSEEANKEWNWNRGEAKGLQYTCTSTDLGRAMRRAPHLKVFVASGRYDLGTPYSASDWSLAQLDIPADVRQRITHCYYDAGHMMYTRQADLLKLRADLTAWLQQPAPVPAAA
jgi:carboxypeptidase C (cathepsin A)